MKICRTAFCGVLLLVLSGNSSAWGQQPTEGYRVNGHVSSWKQSSTADKTIWESTETRAGSGSIQIQEVDPPAPKLEFETPEEVEPPSPKLKFESSPEEDDPNADLIQEGSKAEPDSDEDDDEITGKLEPKRRSTLEASTIDAINPLRRPMSSLSIDVRDVVENAPGDESDRFTNRDEERWSTFAPQPVVYAWASPNIRYQPLYFENVPLERYGQTFGPLREVARGGIHFFNSTVALPYHAAFDHRHSCDYPLGFCRPGSPTQRTRQFQWWGW